MMLRGVLLLCAGSLLAAGPTKEEAIKKDKDELQGAWTVIQLTIDGKDMAVEKLVGAKIVFKDDMVSGKVIRLGKGNECPYKLDPTQKTKAIDFVHKDGVVTPGIYELRSNKMQICNAPPKTDRPQEFKSKKGEGLTLFVLRRDK